MKRSLALALSIVLLPLHTVSAVAFTDVQSNHPFADAIYDLQRRGIVKGNPDGSFAPKRELNRAELLTMIYRANKKEVRAIYHGCAPDVPNDAWFATVVCTAIHDKFVQGYPDGKFRPQQIVNNVEAIKMILLGLNFTVPNLTLEDQVGIDYKYVNVKAWYSKYLFRAVTLGIIPPELTEDNEFNPDAPVTRALAAEMLYRALNADDSSPNWNERTPREEHNNPEVTPTGALLVPFPIHKTGKTGQRGAAAFAFDLSEQTTVFLESQNLTSANVGLECFVYHLSEQGFSSEFYTGYKEGAGCYVRATLKPGRYQVEVRSPSEGADYSLDAIASSGDGNDGFVEAVELKITKPYTGKLTAGDYKDWFHFTVGARQPHRVKVSSQASVKCLLFPGANVDLSSFSVPKCGETSEFDPGDWYVGVSKTQNAGGEQSYTVELR